MSLTLAARRIEVRGIVQGVGFRPFVYRLAHRHGLNGWIYNGDSGVEIHVEGAADALERFVAELSREAPPAAKIASLSAVEAAFESHASFVIRESERRERPTVRVSPDLPVCAACLYELFDPADRRFGYPYINCTDCGPRYSIISSLPYDRPRTTMGRWRMCERCDAEYHDPLDRRFHAQPVACPACGPTVVLVGPRVSGELRGSQAIGETARLLREGAIVAIKGIGGYHLACDAANEVAVAAMRERKYRKERPFAIMVPDLEAARRIAHVAPEEAALLASTARPIVLLRAAARLPGVSPDNADFGVMLPYTPLQHLLFAAGAPGVLVMTSANRSSEPLAYEDDDALQRLAGIADAFLVGEREIARRVDDSVARRGPAGPMILRHGRGMAPQSVAAIPAAQPILAVGPDLKNAITLVVDGQAFGSQHIGDLEHFPAYGAFVETARDLCAMYDVRLADAIVAHDAHPQYVSTTYALSLPGRHVAVQHHRAHIASVLAERGEFERRVIGVSFDGTGYGDDGAIWGGEIFAGSVATGFERVAHLREAALPGGDAAARLPAQAAAGFLAQLDGALDFTSQPFGLPIRYRRALAVARSGVRTFRTTSVGRLFDTVAALLGFTREITFEAQAAMWLEYIAQSAPEGGAYPFPLADGELDFRPLLEAIVEDRRRGRSADEIARAFHAALADGIVAACAMIGDDSLPVVLSGGVFQNALLVEMLSARLGSRMWLNERVPANDGGISLGQAAIAAFSK